MNEIVEKQLARAFREVARLQEINPPAHAAILLIIQSMADTELNRFFKAPAHEVETRAQRVHAITGAFNMLYDQLLTPGARATELDALAKQRERNEVQRPAQPDRG